MMETILNLGLNDATVEGLATRTGNDRFAWDCYRRFVMMFANVVLGVRREVFDAEFDAAKSRLGVKTDPEVPAAELRKLTDAFKNIVNERTGRVFPGDVKEQLRLAIHASTPSSCPTRRARTSSPGSVRRCRSRRSASGCRRSMTRSSRSRGAWNGTTRTCKTSNSPCRTAPSTSCRRAPASDPRAPR